MSDTQRETTRLDLLQGTLDMLILRSLQRRPRHGQEIIGLIRVRSGGSLVVNHGSLYPALQRLLKRGLVRAEWGTSDNNRRARYYSLTAAGRKRLSAESTRWQRFADAIGSIMAPEEVED